MKEYTNNEVANEVAEPQAVYSYASEEVLLYDGLSAEELRRIEKSKTQIALGMVIDDDEVERIIRRKYHYEHQMVWWSIRKLWWDIKDEIKDSPYFLAQYIESLGLYKRSFFKGKFALYYQVKEELIYIVYFRSNKQRPLYTEN